MLADQEGVQRLYFSYEYPANKYILEDAEIGKVSVCENPVCDKNEV
jgi:hypothetical protein